MDSSPARDLSPDRSDGAGPSGSPPAGAVERLALAYGLAWVVWVAAAGGLVGSVVHGVAPHPLGEWPWLAALLGGAVAGALVLGGTAWMARTLLRGDGSHLARWAGGEPLGLLANPGEPAPAVDELESRLIALAGEVARSLQMPRGKLFVLRAETAINAFAAGWTPATTAIAVSRGALETLGPEEMRALLAHEFAHVRRGDARLQMAAVSLVWGFMWLHVYGEHQRRPDSDGTPPGPMASLLGTVTSMLGHPMAWCAEWLQQRAADRREVEADRAAADAGPQHRVPLAAVLQKAWYQDERGTGRLQGARLIALRSALLWAPPSAFRRHPDFSQRLQTLTGQTLGPLPCELLTPLAVDPELVAAAGGDDPAGAGADAVDLSRVLGLGPAPAAPPAPATDAALASAPIAPVAPASPTPPRAEPVAAPDALAGPGRAGAGAAAAVGSTSSIASAWAARAQMAARDAPPAAPMAPAGLAPGQQAGDVASAGVSMAAPATGTPTGSAGAPARLPERDALLADGATAGDRLRRGAIALPPVPASGSAEALELERIASLALSGMGTGGTHAVPRLNAPGLAAPSSASSGSLTAAGASPGSPTQTPMALPSVPDAPAGGRSIGATAARLGGGPPVGGESPAASGGRRRHRWRRPRPYADSMLPPVAATPTAGQAPLTPSTGTGSASSVASPPLSFQPPLPPAAASEPSGTGAAAADAGAAFADAVSPAPPTLAISPTATTPPATPPAAAPTAAPPADGRSPVAAGLAPAAPVAAPGASVARTVRELSDWLDANLATQQSRATGEGESGPGQALAIESTPTPEVFPETQILARPDAVPPGVDDRRTAAGRGLAARTPAAGASAASADEAASRLARLHGPGELRAAILAFMLTPGSDREYRAWRGETEAFPRAQQVLDDLTAQPHPARLPWFSEFVRRAAASSIEDRRSLVEAARRVMTAAGVVKPLERLRWLALRHGLGQGQKRAIVAPPPAARGGEHSFFATHQRQIGTFTAFLARLVPLYSSDVGIDPIGERWYELVMHRFFSAQQVAPARVPDSDSLVHALWSLQSMPWMSRPPLIRAWVGEALSLSSATGLSPEAADALYLTCMMLDSPMPPELARFFADLRL